MKLTRAQIAELLRSTFPEMSVDTVEFLGEGDFCRAFLLNDDLVVRVAKHDEASRALEREACVLPALAPRLTVKIPVPVSCVVRTPESGHVRISLHTRVPGAALTAEEWDALPSAVYRTLAQQLGEFFAALHSVPLDLVSECGVTMADHRSEAMRLHRELGNAAVARLPGRLIAALDAALLSYIAGGTDWSYRPAILNADVSPEHVLVDVEQSGFAGVIDWGDVCIGDPARDFIFLHEDWKGPFLRDAVGAYAPENPETFRRRVLQHSLMDQLAWTLRVNQTDECEDFHEGVRALEEVVDALSPPGD